MFAKRRADVPNLGFSPFHKLCAQGNGTAINPAHRKHFSVGSTLKKIETIKKKMLTFTIMTAITMTVFGQITLNYREVV
jgi:hypothetical protein